MPRPLVIALLAASSIFAQDPPALFQKNCAACHRANSETRAPQPEALARLTKQTILAALETGSMKAQGAALTTDQRATLAAYLSKTTTPESPTPPAATCTAPLASSAASWNGWGVDIVNSRYQPASAAQLTAAQVPNLKLKWAFGFTGANSTFGQPTIAGGRLFLGSDNGTVYALDAHTGCTYWTFKAPATVRGAISVDLPRKLAWFGDVKANVYAINTDSGALIWKVQVDPHPFARVTGSPMLYAGRLYVPVSSVEEVPSGNAKYACCTFRGSVVALDALSGKQIWKSYAIPDPAGPTKQTDSGPQLFGPSGAAIWSAPTIDTKRKAIYVATGNAYSDPPVKYTDAILAFDLETGSMRWARQMTAGDGWNFACINPVKVNCPVTAGEDMDFGSSPVLRDLPDGRTLLIAGQKSGIVHALDPDKQGDIVWQTRIGRGGALGGVEWGFAVDDENAYVPLSDWAGGKPENGGGLFALKLSSGEKVWSAMPPKPACLGKPGCATAQMAPTSAIPGVVFSGSMDGHLRGYDARDGKVIWDFDTLRDFETVNAVKAHGGSLNATGPTIANGMLFVNSGYGQLGGMPGNVLLAFAP